MCIRDRWCATVIILFVNVIASKANKYNSFDTVYKVIQCNIEALPSLNDVSLSSSAEVVQQTLIESHTISRYRTGSSTRASTFYLPASLLFEYRMSTTYNMCELTLSAYLTHKFLLATKF